MKRNITSKTVLAFVGFVALAMLVSSCSRGGHGCPYELQAAADVIKHLG